MALAIASGEQQQLKDALSLMKLAQYLKKILQWSRRELKSGKEANYYNSIPKRFIFALETTYRKQENNMLR